MWMKEESAVMKEKEETEEKKNWDDKGLGRKDETESKIGKMLCAVLREEGEKEVLWEVNKRIRNDVKM